MAGGATGVTLEADRLIVLRPLSAAMPLPPHLAAQPGGFVTRRMGQGMEMAGTRAYAIGDDLRHLDRAATARTGRLHTRQFQEERDRVTLLVADLRAPMFWGLRRAFRSVAAAEVLALFGWHRVETGGRVALLAITPEGPVVVPPRGRYRGMLDVIGGLVEAHRTGLAAVKSGQGAEAPLETFMLRARRLVPPGAEILIASGFDNAGAGLADRLDELERRRHPGLILITAAEDLPAGRYPMRLGKDRLVQVRLGGGPAPSQGLRRIANRVATVVHASDPPQMTAARLSRPQEAPAA